jgi:anaerobic selenocysteine-containing dehydrogenase/Fe-S-cluster-containing dehydrogenase component
MAELDRRGFLKLVGTSAGAAAAAGCSELPEKLIPYVIQPEEITPGLAVIYASTCQECSVGCGVHVRTREGRPVKLEGNPDHPINRGALCARGQAGLSRTYHPDRYQKPMAREAGGQLQPVAWDQAIASLSAAARAAQGKVAVLSAPVGPTLSNVLDTWLLAAGGGTRVEYDPFAPEALRHATETVFGVASVPIFDLSDSDFVIDFGSDCLSTGLSPVEHARQLAAARDAANESGRAARLVYIGPRLDETAGVADEWLPARPGTEGLVALALARAAVDANGSGGEIGAAASAITRQLSGFDAEAVAAKAEISADAIRRIGAALAKAKRPVALPPGVALTSSRASSTAAAVLLLNAAVGAIGKTVTIPPAAEHAPSFAAVTRLIEAMNAGQIEVLIVHGANPVHSLPAASGFAEALGKVKLVVSTASMPDETSTLAHLVLPDHTAAESWGDAAPRPGVRSLVQPTLRPLYDTRAFGDTLLDSARAIGGAAVTLPAGSFRSAVEAAWGDTDWRAALARGGVFESAAPSAPGMSEGVARLEFKEPELAGDGGFVLLAVPSPLLGDGRGANLPLLQETPDPITKIAWQSWAEISTKTAQQLGVQSGDLLAVETPNGKLVVPAWPRGGVRDDVIALAIGQGHTVGSFAAATPDDYSIGKRGGDVPQQGPARGVNVNALLPAQSDERGARVWLAVKANVTRAGGHQRLPFTQGTDNKRGRLLGESISLAAFVAGGASPWAANETPGHVPGALAAVATGAAHGEPGEHGQAGEHGGAHHAGPHEIRRVFDPVSDSGTDDPYRWGMTIDVDKCTGCSACVVACAVENNIPTVGESGVLRNRGMNWLRIERYIGAGEPVLETGRPDIQSREQLGNTDVRNSPMLCQQCGAAPCEPVCPVFATYHSSSGLNGMTYNRCIGTRYCSNNCPYKVRRFNWFDYQIERWPAPMGLGLNPDVTVRGQGVMEKCTFCVQRIQSARLDARTAGRPVAAGEIQTACQQTCATGAIVFDNLKLSGNKAGEAAKANATRSYHALHVLNTRPAITYLAKVAREEGHEG